MKKDLVMARKISCPHCGKQLNISPDLAGKKVACPRCAKQFRFSLNGGEQPSYSVEVAPQNPDLYPPGAAPEAAAPPRPTPEPEERAGGSGGPSPERRADQQPATSPAAKPAKRPWRDVPEELAEPPRKSVGKEVETARFIKPDANATNVKLGADGQLPDLALAKEEKHQESHVESAAGHPLVLISVLCMSVLMSIAILLIDEPTQATRSDAAEARAQLEAIYNAWDRQDAAALEVRDLLGRAQQAYNRGDAQLEKRIYRRILDVLNREDAPKYGGFSGNDKKLKEVLGELLR